MIVLSSDARIPEIVGISFGDRLKFSPFIYLVKIDNLTILTNTFTRFFCVIDKIIVETIKPGELVSNSIISIFTEEEFNILIANRVVIDENTDEFQTYMDTYTFLDSFLSKRKYIDRYNILTSTGCNARCYYCFEEGYYPKVEHMSIETADKVVNYIIKTAKKDKKIYLRWFGGEPLINTKVLDYISTKLQECNIDFFSTMSTNGLLCNKKIIESAKQRWKMSKIRITLDGWGDEHNRRKNFQGTKDGFSIILRNIDYIVKSGIIMVIRLSVDNKNFSSLLKLTHYFIDKYKGISNFKMYAHCLHNDLSENTYKNSYETFRIVNESRDKLAQIIMDAHMYDYERLQPDGFRMYLCAAQDPTKISITPSGGICRCECLSNEEVTWGKVGSPIEKQEIYDYWHGNINDCRDKCKKCFMLPLCTPFSICPLNFIQCQYRFENTLKLNMIERYRRWKTRDSEIALLDSIPVKIESI